MHSYTPPVQQHAPFRCWQMTRVLEHRGQLSLKIHGGPGHATGAGLSDLTRQTATTRYGEHRTTTRPHWRPATTQVVRPLPTSAWCISPLTNLLAPVSKRISAVGQGTVCDSRRTTTASACCHEAIWAAVGTTLATSASSSFSYTWRDLLINAEYGLVVPDGLPSVRYLLRPK
jgi:hypothetical protein